jgi:hypothetical protein
MEETPDYPPAPWPLKADMFIALVRMPPGSIPRDILPSKIRLGRPDRPMNLAAVFVDYRPGGILSYREFLVGTVNRTMTSGTILKIWVDSEQSLAGGRDLWFIPKGFGRFKFDVQQGFSGTAFVDERETASLTFVPRWNIPGRWSYRNTVVQQSGDTVRRTTSRFRSRFQIGTGHLHVPADSQVSFLRDGTPFRFTAIRDLTARFGVKSADLRPGR